MTTYSFMSRCRIDKSEPSRPPRGAGPLLRAAVRCAGYAALRYAASRYAALCRSALHCAALRYTALTTRPTSASFLPNEFHSASAILLLSIWHSTYTIRQ